MAETAMDMRRNHDDSFESGLLKHRPNLKAYACSLARDADVADDLVQETILRALAHHDKFDRNTNQRAWLFAILKNLFRSKVRLEKRDKLLSEAFANHASIASPDAQVNACFLNEVLVSLMALPAPQIRAIILVAAHGYSIDEAASKESCASGTIKSRVSRGRDTLANKTSWHEPS